MPVEPVNYCGTGSWSGPLPGDPDNNITVAATAGDGGITVSWSTPTTNAHAVAHYRIYRSLDGNPANALLHAVWGGNKYFDQSPEGTPPRYYYWIEIVSVHGTVGALVGPASAQADSTISQLIAKLTGQIDAGLLALSLQSELDRIQTLDDALVAEVANRINDNGQLAAIVAAAQGEVAQALTYIYDETQSRITADAAALDSYNILAASVSGSLASLVSQVNLVAADGVATADAVSQLSASVGNDIAALTSQVNLAVSDVATNAAAITQLETSLGDDIAAVATTAQTNINALTGEVNALYTAKVTVNGLVGGFGLGNNGTQIEAGFDVDTFWVGRTGPDKVKPFIITGGVVYIATAMIEDASITNAKIGSQINSTNYVAGISGWVIKKDGTAEFNTGTFRGSINIGNFTGYSWPAAGGTGAHLGPNGLLLGNANASAGNPDGKYFQISTPVGGVPSISTNIPAYLEDLQVGTTKIASNAVSSMNSASGATTCSTTLFVPANQTMRIVGIGYFARYYQVDSGAIVSGTPTVTIDGVSVSNSVYGTTMPVPVDSTAYVTSGSTLINYVDCAGGVSGRTVTISLSGHYNNSGSNKIIAMGFLR